MTLSNPGAVISIIGGCTCPVIDNNRGVGIVNYLGNTVFIVAQDCPIHSRVGQPDPPDPPVVVDGWWVSSELEIPDATGGTYSVLPDGLQYKLCVSNYDTITPISIPSLGDNPSWLVQSSVSSPVSNIAFAQKGDFGTSGIVVGFDGSHMSFSEFSATTSGFGNKYHFYSGQPYRTILNSSNNKVIICFIEQPQL